MRTAVQHAGGMMAFDEKLAEQVRGLLAEREVTFEEKRMMGGLCLLVDGKMCLGIDKQRLMVRIDPEIQTWALERKGCVPMDFTGRPMRGFVFVTAEGTKSKRDLVLWVELALEFNPRAVASKKKKGVGRKKGK
ncbi:MAG: TfoX/Sxy family protein [Planctomycetales bacterium]